MRTGVAQSPLHTGHCPPWLFDRMRRLSAAIIEAIVADFGPHEVLARLADPVWFQAFGNVLGFDWHSSGLTTVVCGALKEGLAERQGELGISVAGGKGRASRKTPAEIETAAERHGLAVDVEGLQYASRMAAKVDNNALQDGFQLYHHVFVFTADGTWCVIQQGMDETSRYARRYHWLSRGVEDFVLEPHSGILGDRRQHVLNLVARESDAVRQASTELVTDPKEVLRVIREIHAGRYAKTLHLPPGHAVPNADRLDKILYKIYDVHPETYRDLVGMQGVGASTLRALAMVAEVVYGAKPSREDPVGYSFAHGGKDGHPRPVNRVDYDTSIQVLQQAIEQARLGNRDKLDSLRRLALWRERGRATP